MKLFLMSSALSLLASASCLAADLPSRRAVPAFEPPPAPAFSWTGAYVGATAGYAFNTDHDFFTVGNNPATAAMEASGARPAFLRLQSSGFTGGGEIGYNHALGSVLGGALPGGLGGLVVGIEADAQYVGSSANAVFSNPNATTFHARTDFVGTVRGRIGYAFDRLLVYATGGFAYGEVHNSVLNDFSGAQYFGTATRISKGYDVGGGVEYAIPTDSILNKLSVEKLLGIDKKLGLDIFDGTIKAEYVHYDLGRETFAVNARNGNPGGYVASTRTEGNLIRVGLGYKFNGLSAPAVPVVARY